jgi:hypothetical protein
VVIEYMDTQVSSAALFGGFQCLTFDGIILTNSVQGIEFKSTPFYVIEEQLGDPAPCESESMSPSS